MRKNENIVLPNLHDMREKHVSKFKLGRLIKTADNKRVFSKGHSTNWSFKLYTFTEVIHDTTPSHQLNTRKIERESIEINKINFT